MLILGINGNFSAPDTDLYPNMYENEFHDASACLLRGGNLVCAVEEERLNRIKRTTKFPINAVRFCLESTDTKPSEIDAVAYYFREDFIDLFLSRAADYSGIEYVSSRERTKRYFENEFAWELPDEKLNYVPHHLSHASSSFFRSGMKEALALVMDGTGEEHSGTVYLGHDGNLDSLHTYSTSMHSLGMFYMHATLYLGYRPGDEYKVMGLAPYGNPKTYRTLFADLYSLEADGNYTLKEAPITMPLKFASHGVPRRRKGEDFLQAHKDFAASLQETLEIIVLHVLGHWSRVTNMRKLCFSGGVAHNSTLNGKILASGLFDEVFIHPASHDAGAAEGAALVVGKELTGNAPPRRRLSNTSVGPDLGTRDEIRAKLERWTKFIDFETPDDIVDTAANLLANGAVLGWTHGAGEFGPRALGNRSILADPRPKSNQTRINSMVKRRESFRPFAPVTTADAAAKYFDLPDAKGHYDFMSFVVPVRSDYRQHLGAVTHVDGTARLQVVDPAANGRFHRLVERFGEITGTPVILNTSFNNNAEPIVQSVDDILACYLTTNLDMLVVDDFLIRRSRAFHLGEMVLRFRPVTKLKHNLRFTLAGHREECYQISLEYSLGFSREISRETFLLLQRVDGIRTLDSLLGECGLDDALATELFDLWQERFITLTPY